MKKAYQIDERKAINRFRSYPHTNPGNIQMVLPLADLAQRLRHGVSQMLFDTERDLLMLIIQMPHACFGPKTISSRVTELWFDSDWSEAWLPRPAFGRQDQTLQPKSSEVIGHLPGSAVRQTA